MGRGEEVKIIIELEPDYTLTDAKIVMDAIRDRVHPMLKIRLDCGV